MASSEPSRKRGREEVPPPPPADLEKVPPPPPTEPEEVPPPPPEEVPPTARGGEAAPARGGEAAPAQGGAAARGAPVCSFSKFVGCLLVREDAPLSFPKSCKVSVHLGVQQHTHPL
jgi:hypothetical protein